MNEYTIVRKRTVVQIQTYQVEASTEVEALVIANADQSDGNACDENEWHTLEDVIEYPVVTVDDILDVSDLDEERRLDERRGLYCEHLDDCN
jgi:hypothetical protein